MRDLKYLHDVKAFVFKFCSVFFETEGLRLLRKL